MNIPKDPVMLMSFINTQLRDNYSSLEDMAGAYGINEDEIKEKLLKAGYKYDKENHRFISASMIQ